MTPIFAKKFGHEKCYELLIENGCESVDLLDQDYINYSPNLAVLVSGYAPCGW